MQPETENGDMNTDMVALGGGIHITEENWEIEPLNGSTALLRIVQKDSDEIESHYTTLHLKEKFKNLRSEVKKLFLKCFPAKTTSSGCELSLTETKNL